MSVNCYAFDPLISITEIPIQTLVRFLYATTILTRELGEPVVSCMLWCSNVMTLWRTAIVWVPNVQRLHRVGSVITRCPGY